MAEPMSHARKPRSRRLLRSAAGLAAGLLILLDEVARPLFRPLSRALGRLRWVEAMDNRIGRLPAYAILACLLVPFVVVEPLKVLALVWMAEGRVKAGVAVLVLAYLASVLLVDRIYHAGRERLLSIGWFAAIMTRLAALREAVLAPIRRSATFRAMLEAGRRFRALLRRRLGLPAKPTSP
jgi:hypothetical protein